MSDSPLPAAAPSTGPSPATSASATVSATAALAGDAAPAAGAPSPTTPENAPEQAPEQTTDKTPEKAPVADLLKPARLKTLLRYLTPHWFAIAVGALLGVVATIATLWTPRVVENVIDAAMLGNPATPYVTLLAILTAIMIGTSILSWIVLGRAAETVVFDVRRTLVDRFIRGRVLQVAAHPAGELVSRATSDSQLLSAAVSSGFVSIVNGTAGIVGTIVLMGVIDPVMLGITLGAVVLFGGIMAALMPAVGRHRAAAQESLGRMGGELEGSVRALRTVKAAGAESRRIAAVADHAADARRHGIKAVKSEAVAWTFAFGGIQAALVVIIGVGAWRVSSGHLSIAALVAFLMYLFNFVGPVMEFAEALSSLQSGLAASQRIIETEAIETEPVGPEHGGGPVPGSSASDDAAAGGPARGRPATRGSASDDAATRGPASGRPALSRSASDDAAAGGPAAGRPAPRGSASDDAAAGGPAPSRPRPRGTDLPVIELDGVTARYTADGPDVVKNLNLRIPRTGHTAVVGPSGAGKTSLLALLLRFLDPDSGTLRVDGVPYADLTHAQVRERFALVEQDTPVVPGTIRDNLLVANPTASDAELAAVLDAAQLTDQIAALPDGLDTSLVSSAVSGGQRQRIALARALLAGADVLLLDEATSQLDGRTEAAIQSAIHEAARRGAVVTVAHRLSTVVDADTIVVMDDGRVRATGTHAELLATDSLYREFVTALRIGDLPAEETAEDLPRKAPVGARG